MWWDRNRGNVVVVRLLPIALTGLVLFGWALVSYLTTPLSADQLAEAIGVQRLLDTPDLVLTYPGQRHGGVVEVPILLALESLSPGNPYVYGLPRLLLVPLAGILCCVVVSRLMPRASLWPVPAAAAVLPAVLQGPMIVNALYPMSWLLAFAGTYATIRGLGGGSRPGPTLVVGGLLISLAVFEHPAVVMLLVPLLAMTAARYVSEISSGHVAAMLGGIVLGAIPLVASRIVDPPGPLVWDPVGLHAPPLTKMFGLSGNDTVWMQALMPNGAGLLNGPIIPWGGGDAIRFGLCTVLVLLLIIAALHAVIVLRAWIRARHPVSALGLASIAWLVVLIVTIALLSIVQPVWFYGTSLGFLVWMAVAAFTTVAKRAFGVVCIALVLGVAGSTTYATSWGTISNLGSAIAAKESAINSGRSTARELSRLGADVIYGDYWQVIPIAYLSGGSLLPITTIFNRFDARDEVDADGHVAVAVRTSPQSSEEERALSIVIATCRERAPARSDTSGFAVFDCPLPAIQPV